MTNLVKALGKLFPSTDISWRVGLKTTDGKRGQALPYLNTRRIQHLLDEVVGPENWKVGYHEVVAGDKMLAVRCALAIKAGGEWVAKEDAAHVLPGGTEYAVKSAYTDALRRAAIQWGIARYLHAYQPVYVDLVEGKLASVPGLPAELLPPDDTVPESRAPGATQQPENSAPPEEGDAGQAEAAPAENAGQLHGTASDPVPPKAEEPKAEEPKAAQKPEAAQKPVNAEAANGDYPQNMSPAQSELLADLEKKMLTLAPHMIAAYIDGPKGKEKLTPEMRQYIHAKLAARKETLANQQKAA